MNQTLSINDVIQVTQVVEAVSSCVTLCKGFYQNSIFCVTGEEGGGGIKFGKTCLALLVLLLMC